MKLAQKDTYFVPFALALQLNGLTPVRERINYAMRHFTVADSIIQLKSLAGQSLKGLPVNSLLDHSQWVGFRTQLVYYILFQCLSIDLLG